MSANEPAALPVKVSAAEAIYDTNSLTGIYATSVHVVLTQNEIFLDFGQLLPESAVRNDPKAHIKARIILSHQHARTLIDMLKGLLEKGAPKL